MCSLPTGLSQVALVPSLQRQSSPACQICNRELSPRRTPLLPRFRLYDTGQYLRLLFNSKSFRLTLRCMDQTPCADSQTPAPRPNPGFAVAQSSVSTVGAEVVGKRANQWPLRADGQEIPLSWQLITNELRPRR